MTRNKYIYQRCKRDQHDPIIVLNIIILSKTTIPLHHHKQILAITIPTTTIFKQYCYNNNINNSGSNNNRCSNRASKPQTAHQPLKNTTTQSEGREGGSDIKKIILDPNYLQPVIIDA